MAASRIREMFDQGTDAFNRHVPGWRRRSSKNPDTQEVARCEGGRTRFAFNPTSDDGLACGVSPATGVGHVHGRHSRRR